MAMPATHWGPVVGEVGLIHATWAMGMASAQPAACLAM